ncbi:TipAS antibiotic-recognition domain-containing protein, partial [Nocardia farcinica]|uniref:TipAS antibiotic-recognition domain-containing protein n=1 Tax=Nocardia farcinica TaxID=37329 RepID=UPI002457EDCC
PVAAAGRGGPAGVPPRPAQRRPGGGGAAPNPAGGRGENGPPRGGRGGPRGGAAGPRRRYGAGPQWQQFAERAATRSPEDWQAVAAEMTDLEQALGAAMDAGIAPGSPEANDLVDRHRAIFGAYFPIDRAQQVCLGRMFDTDPGFTAHYDGIRAGLASWLRRSIDAAARAHGIDPDTATWQ